MRCRECLFYRPDGDGLGMCSLLDLAWGKGSGSACMFVHNTVFVVGPDFGCIHAESRNLITPLAPKEKELGNIGGWSERMQHLIEAIGRHPVAEDDPSVIDAINAVGDALKEENK